MQTEEFRGHLVAATYAAMAWYGLTHAHELPSWVGWTILATVAGRCVAAVLFFLYSWFID